MIVIPKVYVPNEVIQYLEHLKVCNGGFLETNDCIYYPKGINNDSVIYRYKELKNGNYTQQRI